MFIDISQWGDDWHICYSRGWELSQYGIGKGHKDGIRGQFPEIDWRENFEFIMEQVMAIDKGFCDMPQPGFRVSSRVVKL